jgi:primary-amine oxidase
VELDREPDVSQTLGGAPTTGITAATPHPLDPLTPDEIRAARAAIEKAGKITETVRFPLITLLEPPKAEVLAHRPGAEVQRRVLLIALDLATGDTHEGVVSLASGELEEWVRVPTAAPPYGQAPIMLEEYELVAEIVKADPGWREAIAKRGVEDIDSVSSHRSPPASSGTRRRPASASSGPCRSCGTTPPTARGRTWSRG